MKKIIAFLVAASMALSGFTAVLAENSKLNAKPEQTEATAEQTEATAEPTEATAEPTEATAEPTETSTAEPTETPTPTPEPTPTPGPVYIIKNGDGSSILLTYENDSISSEKMIGSNGSAVSLRNIDGTNYVPFRYLLEKFRMYDGTEKLKVVKDSSEYNLDLYKDKMAEDLQAEKTAGKDVTGIFVWQNVDGKTNIYVLDINGGEHRLTVREPLEGIIAGDGTALSPISENYSTYIPIRTLSLFYKNVRYDVEYDTVFITDAAQTDYSKAKAAFAAQFNDNYATLSDIYDADDNGGIIKTGVDGRRTYCVNKYGDMLVYRDANDKVYVRDESGKDTELKFDKDNFLVYQMFFDGLKIYGIEVNDINDYTGQLFTASLCVNTAGEYEVKNIVRYTKAAMVRDIHYSREEKVVGGYVNSVYYIDYNDGEKVKRMLVDNSDANIANMAPAKVTVDGEEKGQIAYFSTNGKYALMFKYLKEGDNKDEKRLKLYEKQGLSDANAEQKLVEITSYEINPTDLKGVISAGKVFYCIEDLNGGNNRVLKIEIKESVQKVAMLGGKSKEHGRIRNIALINGELYGRITDGEAVSMGKITFDEKDEQKEETEEVEEEIFKESGLEITGVM